MNNHLTKAIQKLKPNSQFTFHNNDYSTIKWHILEGDAPTQAEIDNATEQVQAEEAQAELAKAQAKAAAQAKLAALGLTISDLEALGL